MNKQSHISDVVVLAHLGALGQTYAMTIADHINEANLYPQDPSTVLRHLAVLAKAGFVSVNRKRVRPLYHLTDKGMERLAKELTRLRSLSEIIDRILSGERCG